jgi:hypothetical protein
MGEIEMKRGRGRPAKGSTAMSDAERQAARRRRIREAETTLMHAREAARMVWKWSDSLQYSLKYGQSWRVERDADRLRDSVKKLCDVLLP